ncbi:hypothetical protein BGZ93_000346 [Podila epicladia]|nr:hypothetical protein BGZ93_000346 [Podila epicladia]
MTFKAEKEKNPPGNHGRIKITKDQKTAVASAFIPDSGTLDGEKIDEVKVKFGVTTRQCKPTVDMDQQDINLSTKSKKRKILNDSEITPGWSEEDLNNINRLKAQWPTTVPGLEDYLGAHPMPKYNEREPFLWTSPVSKYVYDIVAVPRSVLSRRYEDLVVGISGIKVDRPLGYAPDRPRMPVALPDRDQERQEDRKGPKLCRPNSNQAFWLDLTTMSRPVSIQYKTTVDELEDIFRVQIAPQEETDLDAGGLGDNYDQSIDDDITFESEIQKKAEQQFDRQAVHERRERDLSEVSDTGLDWGDGTGRDIKKDSNKILALGRTVGYAMTDGSLSSTMSMVCLGSLYDYTILVHDLETLGMPPPAEPYFQESEAFGSSYVLTISNTLESWWQGQQANFTLDVGQVPNVISYSVQFVRSTEYQNLESLQRFLQFLAGLFKDGFGIECTSICFAATPTLGTISGTLQSSSESNAAFLSSIGFCGCVAKNFASAVILSMQNYRRLSDLTRAITIEALIGILREVCADIKGSNILNSLARLCNLDLADIKTLSSYTIQVLTQRRTPKASCDQSVVPF